MFCLKDMIDSVIRIRFIISDDYYYTKKFKYENNSNTVKQFLKTEFLQKQSLNRCKIKVKQSLVKFFAKVLLFLNGIYSFDMLSQFQLIVNIITISTFKANLNLTVTLLSNIYLSKALKKSNLLKYQYPMLPMRSPLNVEQHQKTNAEPSQIQFHHEGQKQSIFEKISKNYGNKSPRHKSPVPQNKIGNMQIHQQNYMSNNQSDIKMYQTDVKQNTKKPSLIRIGSNPNINKQNVSYAILKGRDQSPNKLNSTRKPMINPVGITSAKSPVRNQRQKVGLLQSPSENNIMVTRAGNYNTVGRVSGANMFNQNSNPICNRVNIRSSKCINHSQKTAEYLVSNDEEQFEYCNKCATQLASQGFTVISINQKGGSNRSIGNLIKNRGPKSSNRNFQISRGSLGVRNCKLPSSIYRPHRELPYYPDLKNEQKYHEIMEFLQQLYTVEDFHYDALEQLTQHFENDFRRQIQMTEVFYQRVFKIVQRMRDDHLSDLEADFRKKSQQNLIEGESIKDQIQNLNYIRMDIQSNLQSIVLNVSNQQFQICFLQYRDKVEVDKFQCEQILQRVKKNYPEDLTQIQIENKLARVIQGLKSLWIDQQQNDWSASQKDFVIRRQVNPSNSHNPQKLPGSHLRQKSDVNIYHNSHYNVTNDQRFDKNQKLNSRNNIENYSNYHIASQESQSQNKHSLQVKISSPKINNNGNLQGQQFQLQTNAHFDYRKSGNYQNNNPGVDPFLKKNLNSHRNQNNFDANEHFNEPNSSGIQKKPFRSLFDEDAVSPQFKKI